MAEKKLIPVQGVDQVGIIQDVPAHTLPPNAWSDGRNIRFKDGSVHKREGSVVQFDETPHRVVHADWWPEPETLGLYLTVHIEAVESYPTWDGRAAYSRGDNVRLLVAESDGNPARYLGFQARQDITAPATGADDNTAPDFDTTNWEAYQIFRFELRSGNGTASTVDPIIELQTSDIRDNDWQTTLFTGGHNIIVNNTFDAPHYLDRNLDTYPRWAATLDYAENERVLYLGTVYQRTANRLATPFNPGAALAADEVVSYQGSIWTARTAYDPEMNDPLPSLAATTEWELANFPSPAADIRDNTAASNNRRWAQITDDTARLLPLPGWEAFTPVETDPTANGTITSGCRVIRGVGNRLIAGSIRYYRNNLDGSRELEGRLPGTVRISDIAPAGSVPDTWGFGRNSRGAESLADELEISNSSEIVDIQPLQGQAIVYTTNSIHSLSFDAGGNASQRTVADGFGALLTGAVLEFDGKHFVIGSDDLYIFGGHPGSIQSVADAKVREFFFNDLNPIPNVQETLFMLRDNAIDEIQIYYPDNSSTGPINKMLAWNYRNNTWSINTVTDGRTGTVGPTRGGGIASSFVEFLPASEAPTPVPFADETVANITGNPQDADGSPLSAQAEIQQITTNLTGTIEGPRREIQELTFDPTQTATDFDEQQFTLALSNDAVLGNPERLRIDLNDDFNSGIGSPTPFTGSLDNGLTDAEEANIGGTTGLDITAVQTDRTLTVGATPTGVGATPTVANNTLTPPVPAGAATVSVVAQIFNSDPVTGTQVTASDQVEIDGVTDGLTTLRAREASGVTGLTTNRQQASDSFPLGTPQPFNVDGVADAVTLTVRDNMNPRTGIDVTGQTFTPSGATAAATQSVTVNNVSNAIRVDRDAGAASIGNAAGSNLGGVGGSSTDITFRNETLAPTITGTGRATFTTTGAGLTNDTVGAVSTFGANISTINNRSPGSWPYTAAPAEFTVAGTGNVAGSTRTITQTSTDDNTTSRTVTVTRGTSAVNFDSSNPQLFPSNQRSGTNRPFVQFYNGTAGPRGGTGTLTQLNPVAGITQYRMRGTAVPGNDPGNVWNWGARFFAVQNNAFGFPQTLAQTGTAGTNTNTAPLWRNRNGSYARSNVNPNTVAGAPTFDVTFTTVHATNPITIMVRNNANRRAVGWAVANFRVTGTGTQTSYSITSDSLASGAISGGWTGNDATLQSATTGQILFPSATKLRSRYRWDTDPDWTGAGTLTVDGANVTAGANARERIVSRSTIGEAIGARGWSVTGVTRPRTSVILSGTVRPRTNIETNSITASTTRQFYDGRNEDYTWNIPTYNFGITILDNRFSADLNITGGANNNFNPNPLFALNNVRRILYLYEFNVRNDPGFEFSGGTPNVEGVGGVVANEVRNAFFTFSGINRATYTYNHAVNTAQGFTNRGTLTLGDPRGGATSRESNSPTSSWTVTGIVRTVFGYTVSATAANFNGGVLEVDGDEPMGRTDTVLEKFRLANTEPFRVVGITNNTTTYTLTNNSGRAYPALSWTLGGVAVSTNAVLAADGTQTQAFPDSGRTRAWSVTVGPAASYALAFNDTDITDIGSTFPNTRNARQAAQIITDAVNAIDNDRLSAHIAPATDADNSIVDIFLTREHADSDSNMSFSLSADNGTDITSVNTPTDAFSLDLTYSWSITHDFEGVGGVGSRTIRDSLTVPSPPPEPRVFLQNFANNIRDTFNAGRGTFTEQTGPWFDPQNDGTETDPWEVIIENDTDNNQAFLRVDTHSNVQSTVTLVSVNSMPGFGIQPAATDGDLIETIAGISDVVLPGSLRVVDPAGLVVIDQSLQDRETLDTAIGRVNTAINRNDLTPWSSTIGPLASGMRTLYIVADAVGRHLTGTNPAPWQIIYTDGAPAGDAARGNIDIDGDITTTRLGTASAGEYSITDPRDGSTFTQRVRLTTHSQNPAADDLTDPDTTETIISAQQAATDVADAIGDTNLGSSGTVGSTGIFLFTYVARDYVVSAARALTLSTEAGVRDRLIEDKVPAFTVVPSVVGSNNNTDLPTITVDGQDFVNAYYGRTGFPGLPMGRTVAPTGTQRGHPRVGPTRFRISLRRGTDPEPTVLNRVVPLDAPTPAQMASSLAAILRQIFRDTVNVVHTAGDTRLRIETLDLNPDVTLEIAVSLDPQTNQLFVSGAQNEGFDNTPFRRPNAFVASPSFIETRTDADRPWNTNTFNYARNNVIIVGDVDVTGVRDSDATSDVGVTVEGSRFESFGFGFSHGATDSDTPGTPYYSYAERIHNPMDNEIEYTKSAESVQLLLSDGNVDVRLGMTDSPGDLRNLYRDENGETVVDRTFEYQEDYKVDWRRHGRLFNIRIGDQRDAEGELLETPTGWRVSAYGLSIGVEERRGGRSV